MNRLFIAFFSAFFFFLPASALAADTAPNYEGRLTQIESQGKELCAQIESAKGRLTALEKSGAANESEFRGRLMALETEVRKVKGEHILTSKKLAKLAKLGQELRELVGKIADRVTAVEKTVTEHEGRLNGLDTTVEAQEERIVALEAKGNAFTLEPVFFVGSKDGAGPGILIGMSFDLKSGRVAQVKFGPTHSSSGGAVGALTTVGLLFPMEGRLAASIGGYTLADLALARSGVNCRRLGVGATLGFAYVGEDLTAGISAGPGASVPFNEGGSRGEFAGMALASIGGRL